MTKRPIALAALLVSVSLALSGFGPSSLGLHLRLTQSEPMADVSLAEAPEEIILYFSTKPELAVSRMTLEGPDGEVKIGKLARREGDGTVLVAVVGEPLSDGRYSVSWLTSSGDGHPVRGEFAFEVKAVR